MTRVHVWIVRAALMVAIAAGAQACGGAPSGSVGSSDKPVLTLKGGPR